MNEAMEAAAAAEPVTGQDPGDGVEEQEENSTHLSHDDAISALGKTRQEAADYRTKYSPFRDAFEGIEDSTTTVVLDAVSKLKTGEVDGVRAWLDLGKRMMSDAEWNAYIGTPVPDPVKEVVENTDPDEKLSLHDVGKLLDDKLAAQEAAQRQAQADREIQQEAQRIVAEAESMGFQRGTPQFKALLDIAVTKQVSLADAKAEYEKAFPGSAPQPPATPRTAGVKPAGGVQVADTGDKVAAMDAMSARIDAAIAADGGLA